MNFSFKRREPKRDIHCTGPPRASPGPKLKKTLKSKNIFFIISFLDPFIGPCTMPSIP